MHWRTTTVRSRVTSVSLMWTTPDGNVCMYVCTILAIKEGRHSKLKTMIKEGMSASRGRRRRITHCGERTKKCECARCYPMRRRSSDQRYVAYSLTLKRDEKTLMNRHVMNEKHHNTTTISRPTMTKPFNVVNTKPALCFIIWEPPPPPAPHKASFVTKNKGKPCY